MKRTRDSDGYSYQEGKEEENGLNEQELDDDEEDDNFSGDEAPLFQCWNDAVEPTQCDALALDAKFLWDIYGGDKSTAKSFWIDADAEPQCLLEAMALEIADFHLQGAEYAGVEVWTQFRSSKADKRGLDFHFDKDEKKIAQENEWKHPVVATATYLTTGGAPLVVFETASPEGAEHDDVCAKNDDETGVDHTDNDKKMPHEQASKSGKTNEGSKASTIHYEETDGSPPNAWICYPVKGRHAAFAGNLLHGVAQELTFGDSTDRLSLLANVWLDHRPLGVETLPKEIAQKLNATGEGALKLENDEDREDSIEPVSFEPSHTMVKLKEHVDGETAPLPFESIRAQLKKESIAPVIHVSYCSKES